LLRHGDSCATGRPSSGRVRRGREKATKVELIINLKTARLALRLADRGDLANEVIAKRIIELAKTGELNPDVLCEGVVKEFREQRL
jgi:hypothetical protein